MFAPEGYLSWQEIVNASTDWTYEIVGMTFADQLHQTGQTTPEYKRRSALHNCLVREGLVENLSEAYFAMGVMQLWILANFLDQYDVVLCSPNGNTLRCPPLIKAHGDAFEWWLWPLSKDKISNGEAHGYFEGFRAGTFGIDDARARFPVIDFETGNIRLKANSVRLLDSTSYGCGENDDDIRRFIDEQVRPILGWSVCLNEDVLPSTKRELFISLGFTDLERGEFDVATSNGSTKSESRLNILECLMTAYPDGKGKATWPVVEAEVGYSRRSIVRALKDVGRYETWAKNG